MDKGLYEEAVAEYFQCFVHVGCYLNRCPRYLSFVCGAENCVCHEAEVIRLLPFTRLMETETGGPNSESIQKIPRLTSVI